MAIDLSDVPALIHHLYERATRAEAQATVCQAEANRQLELKREALEQVAAVEANWRARHKAAMARIEALRKPPDIRANGVFCTDVNYDWNQCLDAVKAAIRGEGHAAVPQEADRH